jgi:hypothetical protein
MVATKIFTLKFKYNSRTFQVHHGIFRVPRNLIRLKNVKFWESRGMRNFIEFMGFFLSTIQVHSPKSSIFLRTIQVQLKSSTIQGIQGIQVLVSTLVLGYFDCLF